MTVSSPGRLYLLRHARSAWAGPGGRDHARTLDERGHGEAATLAAELRRRDVAFGRIVCSSAERARQTLETLAATLPSPQPEFSDDLYALGPDAYWSAVRSSTGVGHLLIVGHNPTIEMFALSLAVPEPAPLEAGFPTCGLAVFDAPDGFTGLHPGGATFVEAIWP